MSTPDWEFEDVQLESLYTEAALILVGSNFQETHAIGSGVFLAEGLIITARHVIDEFWARFGTPDQRGGGKVAPFNILAIQFPIRGGKAANWDAVSIWASTFTDVAFLSVIPGNDEAHKNHPPRLPVVDVLPPNVGTWVIALGYPRSRVDEHTSDYRLTLSISPHISRGKVTAVFPEYRDRGFLAFPCFEIEAPLVGGMSGGPIFNESGHLCGLVCAGQDGQPFSYAVTLWAAMGTMIHHVGRTWIAPTPYPVWALRNNLAMILNWEKISDRIYEESDPFDRRWLRLREEAP